MRNVKQLINWDKMKIWLYVVQALNMKGFAQGHLSEGGSTETHRGTSLSSSSDVACDAQFFLQ